MATSKADLILFYGFKLLRTFPKAKAQGYGPVDIYKRLHRIEAEAHTLAERECNENLPDGYSERKTASILKRLDAVLGFKELGIPVFVNGDPRGYALKIDDEYMREHKLDLDTDWGGYGLLCPEF